MPEVNMTPMMDVIMTILTFFIIVSMTLTSAKTVKDVALPSTDKQDAIQDEPPDPLVVGVDKKGQMILNEAPIDEVKLGTAVVEYLTKNPKGSVVLKADKKVAYEKVLNAVAVLREVGGDRVALAVGDE
ncbi:biopolymer transporter ExbD [filamentous cyanobacterium LEGE 11480]|uniref:Biopolymer transporter ExbD n=2 Tax=Romeriopsis TaxID=2992131 RepID=A0A928Z573_9CYAN|nr:biopolymer transporter ExbD [Romeriopsis navalis LEGE 11480]